MEDLQIPVVHSKSQGYRRNAQSGKDPMDKTLYITATELSELRRRAAAFDFIEQHHTSSGGLHMNGEHAIVLGRCVGRGRTLLEAVEKRMAESPPA